MWIVSADFLGGDVWLASLYADFSNQLSPLLKKRKKNVVTPFSFSVMTLKLNKSRLTYTCQFSSRAIQSNKIEIQSELTEILSFMIV